MCPINFCERGTCIETTHSDFLNKTKLNQTELETLEERYLNISEMRKRYSPDRTVFEGLKEDAMICECPKGYSGKHCENGEFRFISYCQRVVILNYCK